MNMIVLVAKMNLDVHHLNVQMGSLNAPVIASVFLSNTGVMEHQIV